MKLPVDLTTIKPMSHDLNVKAASIIFFVTMLVNFLPSLSLLNDKELLFNIIALGILIITIFIDVCIEIATKVIYEDEDAYFYLLPLISTFPVALAVPPSRRILEYRYKELHGVDSSYQDINFSSKKLVLRVKRYWIMSETGNPQFVVACSQVSSALGAICFLIALRTCSILVLQYRSPSNFTYGHSDYKLSIKSLLKRFRKEPNVSNSDVKSEMKEYSRYVLQIEDDAKLSKRILRNTLKSITRLLYESEEKEPSNLLQLLQRSTRFNGVVEFDNDEVPPLHSEKIQNSWSLVVVTLTTIGVALHNIANDDVKSLFSSMGEGLEFVKHIEEILNSNIDLVKSREAARRVWTEIEVFRKWQHIDLQKKTHKGKKSKEILQWLGDEAVKTGIQFKICITRSLDDSIYKFIASSSMYKISQTILLHCNKQEIWPSDREICEWISTIIADIFCACFINLPRVILMKCHHDAKEKREDNIRTATQLLAKSKKILKILKARQLPNLDVDSMAYIDKWHALPKSEILNAISSNKIQRVSSSSSESLIVTIG